MFRQHITLSQRAKGLGRVGVVMAALAPWCWLPLWQLGLPNWL
jgi:hypothetical protein